MSRVVKLQPIQKTPASEVVANQILELIREGQLVPGDKLPSERELMQMLDVSRPTLREGLRSLARMGIIAMKAGQGSFVEHLGPSTLFSSSIVGLVLARVDPRAVFEARRIVEVELGAFAAERATAEDLRQLERLVEEIGQAYAARQPYTELTWDFHYALARAAGNPLLLEFVRPITVAMSQLAEKWQLEQGIPLDYHHPELPYDTHLKLLNTLRRRDPDAMRQAVREHLDGAYASLLKYLDSR